MQNIIEINNLRKSYKDFTLDNISFSLPKGYIMGFVGPNGAGKSTTIKLMLNMVRREAGEIRLFGRDNIQDETEIKQDLGVVLDDTFFSNELTPSDIRWILSGIYKEWSDKKFNDYLEKFKLPSKKKIKEFSKGMKAKLALAAALSHNAKLLILDEPTSGLDPIVRDDILTELFDSVKDGERGVFFSSHITSDIEKVADYITFIDNGKIVFSTTKDEIAEKYFIVKGGKDALPKIENDIIGYKKSSFGFEALTDKSDEIKHMNISNLVFEKASVDDIMLFYVKGEH